LLPILFTAVLLSGCGKEPAGTGYVARVNNSYLMENDLNELIDTTYGIIYSPEKDNNFYREEIIRGWIDKELLYQQAVKEKITDSDDFNKIMENTKKTLAGSLLLKRVSDDYNVAANPGDVEKFYQSRPEEFKLFINSYLLNIVSFNSEEEAIKFRNIVVQTNWETALNRAEKESLIFAQKAGVLLEEDEIYPVGLKNLIGALYPHEVSIVFKSASSFIVAQLLEKYPEGTIPPFHLIKSKVERRFIAIEKQKFVSEYIKNLYADNEIEIKN
jgi:PBP1b-binding outer membrane lipoprotein LpoB